MAICPLHLFSDAIHIPHSSLLSQSFHMSTTYDPILAHQCWAFGHGTKMLEFQRFGDCFVGNTHRLSIQSSLCAPHNSLHNQNVVSQEASTRNFILRRVACMHRCCYASSASKARAARYVSPLYTLRSISVFLRTNLFHAAPGLFRNSWPGPLLISS